MFKSQLPKFVKKNIKILKGSAKSAYSEQSCRSVLKNYQKLILGLKYFILFFVLRRTSLKGAMETPHHGKASKKAKLLKSSFSEKFPRFL